MFRTSNYELNRPLLLHYKDHNKTKGKKSVPKKGKLKFGDYKNCLKGINDIVLSSNDGKKIKINLLNRNTCINNKDLVIEKEEINCSNIRKRYQNDNATKEDIKKHNSNLPLFLDHSYKH